MNNNNNIDNIIFSGDGRGLNFSTFIGLLAHMYIIDGVNRLTKADLLRRIRGDALDVVAGLAHETTLDDVIRVLSENYAVGETDQLNEVMKLAETRFPSLEMAIAKFIAKTARTEMFNEKTKIMLFTKVIGIELGYEVKKNAPETLSRAVELARTIENSTIDMVGRSMYLGQMTNRLQQDYGGYFQNDNPIMTTSTFINQNQMQTPMLPQPIYTPININPYTPQLQGMNNGFTIQTPMANNGFVPQTPGTPYSTPAAVNAINGNRITCNYCKKLGHRATECYKKRNNERRNEVRTIEVEEETVNAIGSNNISATLLVNGKYVRGLVDTGSSITLLWRSIAEKLQLKINEADKEKTTFVSHIGSFQYTVMPFGLVNGPATFQRMVEELLGEKLRKTAIVFIDDFIVFSNKKEEHAKDLETIFNLFKERRVSVQIEKCEIEKEEIKFLGFKVSREGITYDGSKFIDLQALPPPANQKELMKFLGTVNYFRSFIKDFTSYTQPFFKLLKKNINFTWDKELELNRVKLLKVLAGTNVLSFPKDTMDNVIESDVSNNGIGGVMLQDGKPVCFYSRSLNDAEKKYSVTEKECLAVVECVKYFKSYINGRKVTIITDHQPLKYILTGKFTDRIVKWSMLLQEVDFQIVYRPGKENFLADTLSRYPSGNGGSLDLDIPVYTVTSVSSNEELLEFSKECIERELNKEPFCKAMREYLDNGSLPEEPGIGREILLESEFYCVMDDYLCRGTKHIQSSKKSKFTGFQIVIPKTMIVMVLKMFHECKLLGGHFGFIKTLNKIKERFYWRGMIKDIKHYTQQCNVCLSIKRKYGKKEGLLVPMRVVSEPFHTVGVDFIGPVEFKGVKIYLLVFIDYFSKWPEVFLTQYQDAETVANILFYEIITRYGAPARLVSDRGAVFLSAVVSGINKIFGTKKINSTAYHPQLDGQTENFNSTLIRMLKSFINEELYGNWSELLRCVLFTYRITPHVSTGFSPFFLLYNRQPRLPVDTSLKANFYSNRLILDFANDIAQSIQNNVKRARWFAEQKLEKSKENQEVYYNKGRVPTQIGEGDYVYLHTPYVANGSDVPKKFYRPWTGPFKVIKKKSEVNFELEMGNSLAHRIVNVNRLKKVIN
ncbi:hypothetical protein ACTFIU_006883 [Dictyostelium citrinum]